MDNSRDNRFPWPAILLLLPWVFVEVVYPIPRGPIGAYAAMVSVLVAGIGLGWVLTRLGAYERWIWGLGAGGVIGGMVLAFLDVGTPWLLSLLIVITWGAIARALYLFWIHPRRV